VLQNRARPNIHVLRPNIHVLRPNIHVCLSAEAPTAKAIQSNFRTTFGQLFFGFKQNPILGSIEAVDQPETQVVYDFVFHFRADNGWVAPFSIWDSCL